MSIGCYDADMQKYIYTPFSLELMKLSTFYKRKGEIVCLSPFFAPNKYTKFLYRKDFDDGDYRKEIFNTPNIEWGGMAFSGNTYVPLDEKIEALPPDDFLYGPARELFQTQKKYAYIFKRLENSNHFRLSLDGKTIWGDYEKQLVNFKKNTLFLHDYNLNGIKGAFDVLDNMSKDYIVAKTRISIGNKFPIITNTAADLFKWSTLQPAEHFFTLQYKNILTPTQLFDYTEMCRGKATAAMLEYVVTGGCSSENEFLKERLEEIFLQVCFLRSLGQKISLKYEDGFFSNPKWERLIDLFNCYLGGFLRFEKTHRESMINYDNLYLFVKSFKDYRRFPKRYIFTKEEARELFLFTSENAPNLFKMFYECSNVRLEDGRLIPI